jgi:exonuclease V gamma subunit
VHFAACVDTSCTSVYKPLCARIPTHMCTYMPPSPPLSSLCDYVGQVHDINGRLAEVLQLLRERADFQHVTFEQDAQLAGSNLYGVFAVRAPRAAAGTMPPATSKEPAC